MDPACQNSHKETRPSSIPLTLPRGVALPCPPPIPSPPTRKAPQGPSCNSNQSLKSCNLGLRARVMACEEDINQAAPNKHEGKRRGWGRWGSL